MTANFIFKCFHVDGSPLTREGIRLVEELSNSRAFSKDGATRKALDWDPKFLSALSAEYASVRCVVATQAPNGMLVVAEYENDVLRHQGTAADGFVSLEDFCRSFFGRSYAKIHTFIMNHQG